MMTGFNPFTVATKRAWLALATGFILIGPVLYAETAFGKIKAVSNRTSQTVIGLPLDKGGVHPPLGNKVFQQPSNFVVSKGSDYGGPLSKTFPE